MKLAFTFFILVCFQCSFATTYYISPKGSDENGNGTSSNPWHSLYKATATVTTPGSIIHVMQGSYTETVRSNLSVGVSIEGEGSLSIIQSTLTEEFVAIVIAVSPEGTDGNQFIRNLKFDGNKQTTSWAIEIRGRKNVSIHDCIITDFEDRGIVWAGQADNRDGEPVIYATGNTFFNNTVNNCAKYDGYGRGCLNIGGQEGMLIYNNTITQTGRAKGANGWPVKYFNGGYLKGCKIYNNVITKEAYDGISWDFAIELFNESGLEIYNNTIIGAVDLNHQLKGAYNYSVYIHDNVVGPITMQAKIENGIILEFETISAIIENNIFKNLGVVVNFTPRNDDLISGLVIKNNNSENIGAIGGSHEGYALRIGRDGKDSYLIDNILIDNNKFIGSIKERPYWGIGILGVAKANNIQILRNTLANFSAGCILANPATNIDTLISENNIITANGNNGQPSFYLGLPQNYVAKKNLVTGSTIFSLVNVKMNIIRPVYYEIKDLDLIEAVAMIGIIVCAFLSYRENIYVFPIALISMAICIFLNFDRALIGDAIRDVYYPVTGIYGWVQWRKRNRKGRRIIRITASSKSEKLNQLMIFGLLYVTFFFTSIYLRQYFANTSITWANSICLASGFLAMWLFVKKKTESWYWWITSVIVSGSLSFIEHHLLHAIFYSMLLFLSFIGLTKWKRRQKRQKFKINTV